MAIDTLPKRSTEATERAFSSPPDQGHAIQAEIGKDGKITMTNSRNGFSKSYQVN